MSMARKSAGLVAPCLAVSLLFGCESTQTADTAVEAEPAIATEPAPAAEAVESEQAGQGEVAAEARDDRVRPFSEDRVDELESSLDPLESVPINTGLDDGGNDTSVG